MPAWHSFKTFTESVLFLGTSVNVWNVFCQLFSWQALISERFLSAHEDTFKTTFCLFLCIFKHYWTKWVTNSFFFANFSLIFEKWLWPRALEYPFNAKYKALSHLLLISDYPSNTNINIYRSEKGHTASLESNARAILLFVPPAGRFSTESGDNSRRPRFQEVQSPRLKPTVVWLH